MNRDKFQQFSIDTLYTLKDYSTSYMDSAGLTGRSDIKAIDREVQVAALQVNAESVKSRPDFGVRFDHMFGFGGLPMQYSLMGMARIPIGRANRMSKASAESLKWKSEALSRQRQMIINEATGAAAGLHADIATKKKQLNIFEQEIIPALRRNYQVVMNAYQQNTEQLTALFEAWDALNQTQLQYIDLLLQVLTSQVELERILEIK
jgi:outer membrane protein TolC